MNTPPPSICAWARRLLAAEAANQRASDAHLHQAVQVSEKLRISLTRFVGADGFTALMRRSLALARADVPSLQIMKVTADGRLEETQNFAGNGKDEVEAATAITAHLLGLLVTFVGESLTLRLLRDAWPEASLDE
jgi:hypothetical protein